MAELRPQLSAVEQRVLGALLEKQRTVPVSYPLTFNSLPLVVELERRTAAGSPVGHLLGPLPEPATPPPTPVDRGVVIAADADVRDARVVAGYDAVAAGYARELSAELARKPFDRWLLDRIATDANGGPVADIGTGPGHVAARLAASCASVVGLDLSPAMIDEARNLFPDLEFEVGDLTNLLRPRAAAGWSAITAWYAFAHMATSEFPP